MFASNGSFRVATPGRDRRGLSLLEVLGCILAVVVGVWLGAKYLGLNLHSVAYTTLSETEIMEKLPEPLRPEPPLGLVPQTAKELEQQLQEELESIQFDLGQLEQQSQIEQPGQPAASDEEAEELAGQQETLAFWSRLSEIRLEVDRIQQAAQMAVSEQNVWKVLEIRRRAYQYGAKAVNAAKVDVVDPQVLQFAQQLAGWYEQGAELYGEAMKVWQGQHDLGTSLPQDQALDRARKQHDNEAVLLFQKGSRLREVLIRRYQLPFPSFQPTEAGSGGEVPAAEPTPAPLPEVF